MITLVSILVPAILAIVGFIVAGTLETNSANMKFKSIIKYMGGDRTITLSEEDIKEAKEYAELFGLDNQSVPSVPELLKLGRKIKEAIGIDRVHQLAETVREYNSDSPFIHVGAPSRSRSISHAVNVIVKACRLIVTNQVGVFLSHITGGDRNDEENASRI